jgi:hypothetical protein
MRLVRPLKVLSKTPIQNPSSLLLERIKHANGYLTAQSDKPRKLLWLVKYNLAPSKG